MVHRKDAPGDQAGGRPAPHHVDLLALLDQAPAMIALTAGPDHVFTFANQALRDELAGQDPVGRPLREGMPQWADRPIHETMDTVFGNGEPARGVYVPLGGAAAGHRQDFTQVPLRDGAGTVVGVATFAVEAGPRERDLAAREAELGRRERALIGREAAVEARAFQLGLAGTPTDEALRQAFEIGLRADARRDALLDVVSHALRSPIHVMMGYGAILRQAVADRLTPAERRHLAQMLGATEELAKIVNDLLDLEAIRAGRLVLRPRLVDFGVLVDEALAAHAGAARDRSVRIETALVQGLPPVVGDASRLVQVIGELLENAIRHTPPGGRVVVRTDARAGVLVFQIEDTGVGIAPEALGTIFEPFSRLDTSLTREGGLGAGLAITRGLTEAHGGTVAVSSVPGRGSTFELRLPFAGSGEAREGA